MRKSHRSPRPAATDQEPIGIVIADGGHGDLPTRFAAFVWGPVPDGVTPELPELAVLDQPEAAFAAC